MKKDKLKEVIKEEVRKTLNESKSPINHKIENDYLILIFNNEKEAQEAKTYYSSVHVRTTQDKKGLMIPILSIVRFLTKNLTNSVYNPKNN